MNRAPVTVVGAGVTGLTTALALHEAGYPVRVVDPAAPGSGTSAANGAQLSWAFVAPLAEPGVLPKLPGWLLKADSPIRWVPRLDPALPGWGLQFLRACTPRRAKATTAALLELAALGRPQLDDWRMRLELDFDWRANGKLLLYRDAGALAKAGRQIDFQRRLGVEQRLIERDALLERDLDDLAREAIAVASPDGGPFAISFDIDVINPEEAPGITLPAPGGPSSDRVFDLLARLGRHPNLVAIDVVEVDPTRDHQGATSCFAVEAVRRTLGRPG